MHENNVEEPRLPPGGTEFVQSFIVARENYEKLAFELIEEKKKFVELNNKFTEEISKLERNGNFVFYFFLSSCMFSVVYILVQ